MKKLILILSFIFSAFISFAQDEPGKKAEKIQALKIAFITQKLELTSQEAEKFWPIYYRYENDLKQLIIEKNADPDVLVGDEKILNLRKKYRDEFVRVIGPQKMNRLFKAEGEFRGVLLRQLKNRNQLQRPYRR